MRKGTGVNRPNQFTEELISGDVALDFAKANQAWNSNFSTIEEMFSTKAVFSGGKIVQQPTHLLGVEPENIRLLPYDDNLKEKQTQISKLIRPGEICISIKHHSVKPEPEVSARIKLQCSHIQTVVGVEGGVITVNNPKNYQGGLFGDPDYPMIFVKPKFPSGISAETQKHFVDNIRTWLVIANQFTDFPDNYDGGDPLSTTTKEDLMLLGNQLLLALQGSSEAKEWFYRPENQVYCAELAHLALNLGLYFPLNEKHLGRDAAKFVEKELSSKAFLFTNENPFVDKIEVGMANENLVGLDKIIAIPNENGSGFWPGLAIKPFFLNDMIEQFLLFTIPREKMGEERAPRLQAELLGQVKPALLKMLGIATADLSDPKRSGFEHLYGALVKVVGLSYPSYEDFRTKLQPLMTKIKDLAQHSGQAFVPPHCFLVRASQSLTAGGSKGILEWEYVGHGVHRSLLKREV